MKLHHAILAGTTRLLVGMSAAEFQLRGVSPAPVSPAQFHLRVRRSDTPGLEAEPLFRARTNRIDQPELASRNMPPRAVVL